MLTQRRGTLMAKKQNKYFEKKNPWSEVKDRLLEGYLEPYFQKILTNGRPIYYVDCFAGKGQFDDGQPGSPRIALQARDNALTRSSVSTKENKIEMTFIELTYVDDLKSNTADFNITYGSPHIIHGKYEENIENLLKSKQKTNIFLYIDPYGIKALDLDMFEKFNTFNFQSIEMLINFNSFGFFRNCCTALGVSYGSDEAFLNLDDLVEYEPTETTKSSQSETLVSKIAGGDYWKDIVRRYNQKEIDGYEAEQILSEKYKERLKKNYKYVLDIPIRLKAGHRPKYRMIHVTNHEKGCFLMAANMQKRTNELFTNVQQENRNNLLSYIPNVSTTAENKIITQDVIKAKIKKHVLDFHTVSNITPFLASFVNTHGILCKFDMIYNILNELQEEKFISIERNPPFTSAGKPRTFWDEKAGRTVTLRKIL